MWRNHNNERHQQTQFGELENRLAAQGCIWRDISQALSENEDGSMR